MKLKFGLLFYLLFSALKDVQVCYSLYYMYVSEFRSSMFCVFSSGNIDQVQYCEKVKGIVDFLGSEITLEELAMIWKMQVEFMKFKKQNYTLKLPVFERQQ